MEDIEFDHPSLDASLRDFEPGSGEVDQSPRLGLYPSHHSGFCSDEDSEVAESSVGRGGYSPPAWRRTKGGLRSNGFWEANLRETRSSRESSPEYASADDGDATLAQAARTRLPTGSLSPEKRESPDPYPSGTTDFGRAFGGPVKQEAQEHRAADVPISTQADNSNNYIRFAVRAEVQHRTEPFEAALAYLKSKVDLATKSWTSIVGTLTITLLSSLVIQLLFAPASPLPVPDLVKVAGLAKAFEPLIFYSENGVQQIGDLQATGVAVWDLGESVRSTNMTSAPIIVKSLDDLSESLKTLSIELTKFFANVDGDVDGILIVMDWAKRELSQLSLQPSSAFTSAFTNVHTLFSRMGILETASGQPTRVGTMATLLFGQTLQQRTRKTLHRTFTEFLAVLEESINNELVYSQALFALFESIDRQFLNLARTVVRESDQQERLESDTLASLWTRVLGSNAADLRKYERNKQLLSNVREKTVRNKHLLVDHNGKLMALKANLETLRKKLVSPLVRSNDSSTLTVAEQIRGLDSTYDHLSAVRERQKGKLMEMLYGAGTRRVRIERHGDVYELDG
ncbi:MAG: hypothetical protein M1818_008453 [Claussenomyces sp. TS43310]|nr:MAG: hypothetical protein M1818_008453 [Claussenomyces sp. TS43310]